MSKLSAKQPTVSWNASESQPMSQRAAATFTVESHIRYLAEAQCRRQRSSITNGNAWTAQARSCTSPQHAQGDNGLATGGAYAACMVSLQPPQPHRRKSRVAETHPDCAVHSAPPAPRQRQARLNPLCFSENIHGAPDKTTRRPSLKARRCISIKRHGRGKPHPWSYAPSHHPRRSGFVCGLCKWSFRATGPLTPLSGLATGLCDRTQIGLLARPILQALMTCWWPRALMGSARTSRAFAGFHRPGAIALLAYAVVDALMRGAVFGSCRACV